MNHRRHNICQHSAQHNLRKTAFKAVVKENRICDHNQDGKKHHQDFPPALISIVSPQNDIADAADQNHPQKLPDHQRLHAVFFPHKHRKQVNAQKRLRNQIQPAADADPDQFT